MTWLFEQPLTIVVLGVALLLALGAAWSATGRKELLYALGVALVLMIGALVTERLVTTDREAVRATLLEIARDLNNNDHRRVVSHVYSGKPELKRKAEAELPNYRFSECRITRIHLIKIDESASPRSAMADFNIIATGTFKEGGYEFTDTIPRWIRLHLIREKDGRWGVQAYEHDDPQRMIMQPPGERK